MGIVDPFRRLAAFPVTLDGNGRTIENAATLVLNTNGLNREWFYRADLGGWKKLPALPRPTICRFPNFRRYVYRSCSRCVWRLAMARKSQRPSLLRHAKQQNQFVARYLQSQPLQVDDSISWPFMSTQGYDTQRAFSSLARFQSRQLSGVICAGYSSCS
jgi:hypothetical protein